VIVLLVGMSPSSHEKITVNLFVYVIKSFYLYIVKHKEMTTRRIKKFCIFLLILGAMFLELDYFIHYYLPNMDKHGINLISILVLIGMCFLYTFIISVYDYLWEKYIKNRRIL
jgi:drug/metabolite transporter (DMT)-like permease